MEAFEGGRTTPVESLGPVSLSDSEIVPIYCFPPSTGCSESGLKAVVLIGYILSHPRILLCLEDDVVGPSENNYRV